MTVKLAAALQADQRKPRSNRGNVWAHAHESCLSGASDDLCPFIRKRSEQTNVQSSKV